MNTFLIQYITLRAIIQRVFVGSVISVFISYIDNVIS